MIPNSHVPLFDGSQGLSQTCFALLLLCLCLCWPLTLSLTLWLESSLNERKVSLQKKRLLAEIKRGWTISKASKSIKQFSFEYRGTGKHWLETTERQKRPLLQSTRSACNSLKTFDRLGEILQKQNFHSGPDLDLFLCERRNLSYVDLGDGQHMGSSTIAWIVSILLSDTDLLDCLTCPQKSWILRKILNS